MTEPTEQQRIDRLGFRFMGWTRVLRNTDSGTRYAWVNSSGELIVWCDAWNPFLSLDDARLLLLECERRGLLQKIEWEINAEYVEKGTGGLSLLNTAKQITEAVWVAAGLGET